MKPLAFDPVHVVAIGASSGGVQALSTAMRGLPADLPAAVFVVLHLPPHSHSQLNHILQATTGLKVLVAEDGRRFECGHVYIAPPDRHLVVDSRTMRLTHAPRECRARPSVDVLFRSAAASHGPLVVGVVLTGALDDGTAGLWAIKERGGVALVQDPATAEHPSMPDSARRHVEVDAVVPLAGLAAEIVRHVRLVRPGPTRPASEAMRIETAIALGGNSIDAGVMKLGRPSSYTCPDCHRTLAQIQEGSIVRFRCHSGHAHSLDTLLGDVDASIESHLWESVRAIEERVLLLRELAQREDRSGEAHKAARCTALAESAKDRAGRIRAMALDPQLTDAVESDLTPGPQGILSP